MKIFKIKNYLFCLISGVIFMNAAQAAYSEVGRCIFADYVYYQKVPREVIAWTVDDNMIDPKVEVRLESFGGFKTVPRDQRKLVLDRFSNKYKLTSLTIKGIIPRPHNRMKIPTRNVDATWTLKVAKRKDDTNITMEDWVLDRTCKAKIELYCIVNGDGIDPSKAILPNMMANFGTVSEDDNDGPEACPEGPLVTIHTPGEGEKPVPKSEETEMKTPPGFKKFLCKDKTDISIEGNIAFPMSGKPKINAINVLNGKSEMTEATLITFKQYEADPRYFKIWRLSSTTDWSIVFSGTKPEAIFNDSQKDTLLQCDSELSENLKVALLDANYFKDLACNTYGTYTVRWIMQDGSAYGPDTKNASLPKSPDNCIIKKLSSS